MRKISSVLPRVSMIIYFLSLAFFEQQIYPQQLPQDRYAFNGTVNAVEVGNNTLFVGGDFDMVGPSVQNLTMVDITTNQATLNLPTTDGGIYGIIPDNSGGWYIYGAFTMVGDSVRKSMAHILPDYSVDSWSVSLDGTVSTMLLHNGAIYFGGQFYEVNGTEQWLFAAVDTDGDLIDWDPGFYGNSLETMATDGSVMYFGGNFTQVGTQTRNNLAAIDLSTRELTSWNPNPNSGINTIEISDTIIYVGGAFTNISGMPHTGAAAIGKSGTLLDSWAVNVSGASSVVNCIKKYESVIYLGGNFNKINGYDRTYAGAVDVGGNILNWAPIMDAVVYKIVPLGSSVLVGGDFTTVNGQKRSAIVQVDSNNGNTVMPLNANLGINPGGSFPGGSPKPVIRGMLLQNNNLILCGMMDIVGGKQRTRIAAIDLTTNELLDWAPQIQGTAGTSVSSLKYHNGIVFVGGNLIAVNEIPRKYLAAINFPSGDLLNWNPDPNNRVYSIKIVDTVIYIGGSFTTLGDGAVIRNYLAAISESGTVMDWNPNPDNTVYSIEVKDTALYFGGFFNSVSGETRNRLAAVTTSGNLLPWNPNTATGQVLTIAMCDTIFYVGGSFNGIGGNTTIRKFAAVDINGNLLVDRSFGGANNTVNTVKVLGNNLYVGGLFTFIGTNSRNRIAAINLQTNTLRDDWIVDANNPVNAFGIDATNKVVYVGGSFKYINTSRVLCLAPITDPTIPTQQILPFAPSDLIADADTFFVSLSWADNSNNEDGFVIERKEGEIGSSNPFVVIDSVAANVIEYIDLGLTPVTTYTYRIYSYNEFGNSAYSDSLEVTTLASAPTTFQLSVSVNNNWNIVSIPGLHSTNQNVDTWWTGRNPNTFVFEYLASGYQSVTETAPGKGYWLDHIGEQTYNTGDEWPAGGINIVPNEPISAFEGWNLIGGYHYNAPVSGITTVPVGIQTGFIFGYSSANGYEVADDLVPGYGYWIELIEAGQINIPDPVYRGKEKTTARISDNWGMIIITDKAGKRYTLYGITEEINLNSFNLPPVPPAGMFDVRYSSGRFAEDLTQGNQSIIMSGVEYPFTVKAENINVSLQDESGKIVDAELSSGEQITIDNSTVNKLIIKSGEITQPVEYSLEQNYPNPFNPSTQIKFSLPEAARVSLTIYNLLGQKVGELVNGKLEAGRYSYQWNGKNLSSGMYIYQLKTDNFVSVKKMLMVK